MNMLNPCESYHWPFSIFFRFATMQIKIKTSYKVLKTLLLNSFESYHIDKSMKTIYKALMLNNAL